MRVDRLKASNTKRSTITDSESAIGFKGDKMGIQLIFKRLIWTW
jgi:hypothetical protein